MTSHLDTAFVALTSFAAPLMGSKTATLIADTVPEIPPWIAPFLGPVGALVGLIVALVWMANRLKKSEEKYDKREDERDSDRKALITVVEQNSQAIRDFREVIKGCPGREK